MSHESKEEATDPVEVASQILEQAFREAENEVDHNENLARFIAKTYHGISLDEARLGVKANDDYFTRMAVMNNMSKDQLAACLTPHVKWMTLGLNLGIATERRKHEKNDD